MTILFGLAVATGCASEGGRGSIGGDLDDGGELGEVEDAPDWGFDWPDGGFDLPDGDEGGEGNDTPSVEPGRFAGLFVEPLRHLHDDPAAWGRLVEKSASVGATTLFLPFTGAYGRAFVPAPGARPLAFTQGDTLGALLDRASNTGVKIALGLWADAIPDEPVAADVVDPEVGRAEALAATLADLYRDKAAFGGWVLVEETALWGSPDAAPRERFVREVSTALRRVASDRPISLLVVAPDPAVVNDAAAQNAARALALLAGEARIARVLVREAAPAGGPGDSEVQARTHQFLEAFRAARRPPPEGPEVGIALDTAAPRGGGARWSSGGDSSVAVASALVSARMEALGSRGEFHAVLGEAAALGGTVDPETWAGEEGRAFADKAEALLARLVAGHLREGQVMGLVDGTQLPEEPANLNQPDAARLTGLLVGALAMRAVVTGQADHMQAALRALDGLRTFIVASPAVGELVRAYTRHLPDRFDEVPGAAADRSPFRRHPNREMYYIPGADLDDLCAWVWGLTTFLAVVPPGAVSEAVRTAAAADLDVVVNRLLTRDFKMIDGAGVPVPGGDVAALPVLRWALLKAGAELTRSGQYGPRYVAAMGEGDAILAALRQPVTGVVAPRAGRRLLSWSLAAALWRGLESDPSRAAVAHRALRIVARRRAADLDGLGDVLATSGGDIHGERFALWRRFSMIDVALFDNRNWLRRSFEPVTTGAVPWSRRPGQAIMSEFSVIDGGGAKLTGPVDGRFSGADWLVGYWWGRYHGVFPAPLPQSPEN